MWRVKKIRDTRSYSGASGQFACTRWHMHSNVLHEDIPRLGAVGVANFLEKETKKTDTAHMHWIQLGIQAHILPLQEITRGILHGMTLSACVHTAVQPSRRQGMKNFIQSHIP